MPVLQRFSTPLDQWVRNGIWVLNRIQPIPSDWVDGVSAPKGPDGENLTPLPCNSYRQLVEAWKQALYWTDGLDCALSVMLASAMSTNLVGEQLWVKVQGPPGCLAGSTKVTVNRAGKSFRIRLDDLYHRFHGGVASGKVWSPSIDTYIQSAVDGVVRKRKLVDVIYSGRKPVYLLKTTGGRSIAATADHRFLTPQGYVKLGELCPGDSVCVNGGRSQGNKGKKKHYKYVTGLLHHPHACKVNTYKRPRDGYQVAEHRLVIEAHQNGLELSDYIQQLRKGPAQSLRFLEPTKIVHHKNENHKDNRVENLVVLDSQSEHNLFHQDQITKNVLEQITEDQIESIRYLGVRPTYDLVVDNPNNFLAQGIVVHNSGKTTLLEGLAVSTKYVLSKDSIRGFHAGWRSENGEDVSLIQLARGKTLATKDGDTLLKAPNRAQILSEARAIYDRNSRTHYRNSVANDYVGYRMTWILCGTAALREIDDSELGARFIDCVVMDSIDDDLEDEIALVAGRQENEGMRAATNCSPTTHYSEALATAMRLTGGYVEYLRKNDERLMESVQTSDYAIRKCTRYGKFIALMRARPSADEEATREFCPRLVKQMVRLTNALCVVLNKSGPDREVMRRVKKVALDTSRGPILDICRFLYKNINGLEKRGILIYTGFEDNYLTSLLKFMKKIKIIEPVPIQPGEPKRNLRWRLTERTRKLYHAVYTHDEDA